jgi:hypothetical protein
LRGSTAGSEDPADTGGGAVCRAPLEAAGAQGVDHPPRRIAVAARDDRRYFAVPDVDQPAETRYRQRLLQQSDERAQPRLDVDLVTRRRLNRAGDGHRQRRARNDPAERAEPLRLGVSRVDAVQEILDQRQMRPGALGDEQLFLDGMRFRQGAADDIEELDPEIRQHRQAGNRLLLSGALHHRFARQRPIGPVCEAIGVQRRAQRHAMPGAPFRMRADKAERIGADAFRAPGGDGDDQVQQFAAMAFGFGGEVVVDGVAIFRAFTLQQREGAAPDLIPTPTQAGDDDAASGSACRRSPQSRISVLARGSGMNCEIPQCRPQPYMDHLS